MTRTRFPAGDAGKNRPAMGTGRYPVGTSDEAADTPVEETTLASDDDWRVAEQYRTEPLDGQPDDGDAIVLQQDVPPEPPRRFPPDVGPGVAAAALGVLLAVILVPAGIWLASNTGDDEASATETRTFDTGTEEPPPTVLAPRAVPDLIGRPLAEARRVLENRDLRVRVRQAESERPRGEVLLQAPEPGTDVDVSSIVVLTVSSGVERIVVPDLEGMTAAEAVAALRDAGLEPTTRRVDSDEPEGTVVSQSPSAGEEVAPQATVTLDVAKARATTPPPPTTTPEPATVRVPSLVGMRAAAARERLRALGLRPRQRPVVSSSPAGEVVGQSPSAGAELREGGAVTLRVSTGPASVAVPDVIGMTEAAAIRELEAAGFLVTVVDEPIAEPTEDGFVVGQNPPAGTDRRKGSTVTITVGRFG